jgi:glycosyltransferase involved in cell wall biosynthesis
VTRAYEKAIHPLPSVVHVVPYDGIGGVEVAARSVDDGEHNGFRFLKCYLAQKGAACATNASGRATYAPENDPRAYLSAMRRIWTLKPAVLIASLWRSCFVLLVIKLLRPQTKVVTFLHSASDVHWPDRVLNRMAMRVSNEIWADSQTTLDARVPKALVARARVISFQTERVPAPAYRAPAPIFVFWGRLHPQKGLVRALRLFARMVAVRPLAVFHVIGPDGGDRAALEREVNQLGLAASVQFHGPMDRSAIFEFAGRCTFYLQTSIDEGIAMSVIEAMQLGLVPVVTPVGEIGRYGRNGENAILIQDEDKAIEDILSLLESDSNYQTVRSKAIATWGDKQLYRESVLQACKSLLAI